jgi:hypothetical protein
LCWSFKPLVFWSALHVAASGQQPNHMLAAICVLLPKTLSQQHIWAISRTTGKYLANLNFPEMFPGSTGNSSTFFFSRSVMKQTLNCSWKLLENFLYVRETVHQPCCTHYIKPRTIPLSDGKRFMLFSNFQGTTGKNKHAQFPEGLTSAFPVLTGETVHSFWQCCGSGSARIRIIWPDPGFWMPDPDHRLQNWHLINLFSVKKFCE